MLFFILNFVHLFTYFRLLLYIGRQKTVVGLHNRVIVNPNIAVSLNPIVRKLLIYQKTTYLLYLQ